MASSASASKPKPPRQRKKITNVWVLQWNCRGLQQKLSELKLRLEKLKDKAPDVILLQEANVKNLKIRGYNAFLQPIIVRKNGNYGLTVTLVKKSLPQTQIDTKNECSEHREVVGTRIRWGDTTVDVFNAYIRPGATELDDAWIRRLIDSRTPTILAGDFNAKHTEWGYNSRDNRGKVIKRACERKGLVLRNEKGITTRLAQSNNQPDTTPDLTWTSRQLRASWCVLPDAMGSDHLPIKITLPLSVTPKKKVCFIKWDAFRTHVQDVKETPLAERIVQAVKKAKKVYKVKEDTPTPDLHLVNLWDTRLEALKKYRKRKTLRSKISLNKATAKAKRYANELCRTKWRTLCNSFNEKTGLRRVWRTYRGLAGKTKAQNTGSNIALKLKITEEQLAHQAGTLFFPQQHPPPEAEIYQPLQVEDPAPENAPFTMGELLEALTAANTNSAPGPDQVTVAALRNLPKEELEELLQSYNDIWDGGEIPAEWKRSTVIPIPKPGKPLNTLQNLRPISLT